MQFVYVFRDGSWVNDVKIKRDFASIFIPDSSLKFEPKESLGGNAFWDLRKS